MAANNQGTLSLPAVIHYLQTESSRYERDRNHWELERAEMKARIAKVQYKRLSKIRADFIARR